MFPLHNLGATTPTRRGLLQVCCEVHTTMGRMKTVTKKKKKIKALHSEWFLVKKVLGRSGQRFLL